MIVAVKAPPASLAIAFASSALIIVAESIVTLRAGFFAIANACLIILTSFAVPSIVAMFDQSAFGSI